jgi:hypothetical protein
MTLSAFYWHKIFEENAARKKATQAKPGQGKVAPVGPILDPPIGKTLSLKSKKAGVSHGTYDKGVKILAHASKVDLTKIRNGESSISSVYNSIKKKRDQKKRKEKAGQR